MHAIPNRRYVTVPPRSRGGGGRFYQPGKPGEIIINPFVTPPKPEVKLKVDTIAERIEKGMAIIENAR
jgi:hypothetical protein